MESEVCTVRHSTYSNATKRLLAKHMNAFVIRK